MIISGGRNKKGVSDAIYCLYPSLLDIDPPRLPSVYLSRVNVSLKNSPRYGHASAIVGSDYFVICGGLKSDGTPCEGKLFSHVANIDSSDGTQMKWIQQSAMMSTTTPTPRSGHCLVPYHCKNIGKGVICFGGVTKTGKPCQDVWMMKLDSDDLMNWMLISEDATPIGSNVSGSCIKIKDDGIVVSLCDSRGRVIYVTISFDGADTCIFWNRNLESPKILKCVSDESVPASVVRVRERSNV